MGVFMLSLTGVLYLVLVWGIVCECDSRSSSSMALAVSSLKRKNMKLAVAGYGCRKLGKATSNTFHFGALRSCHQHSLFNARQHEVPSGPNPISNR
ncbi:hypothetical protein SDJN03_10926, partial [Cucurbita argyrosperma subsp. sororia]